MNLQDSDYQRSKHGSHSEKKPKHLCPIIKIFREKLKCGAIGDDCCPYQRCRCKKDVDAQVGSRERKCRDKGADTGQQQVHYQKLLRIYALEKVLHQKTARNVAHRTHHEQIGIVSLVQSSLLAEVRNQRPERGNKPSTHESHEEKHAELPASVGQHSE